MKATPRIICFSSVLRYEITTLPQPRLSRNNPVKPPKSANLHSPFCCLHSSISNLWNRESREGVISARHRTIGDVFDSTSCLRESMWTNGREEVSRRETKRVLRTRVGRRSIASRGPEVERSEALRAESNGRAPAIHVTRQESPLQGDGRARPASGGPEGV